MEEIQAAESTSIMTTEEAAQPQPEQGPVPNNGQVQSQGHRRRRRRRKNKTSLPPAGQAQPQSTPPQPQMQQAPTPAAPPKPGRQQHQGRKKKKFFPKSQASGASQGNGFAPPMQNKRRGRQQKVPRAFVGPMDHSYRAANGNVADGPPSTIQLSSGGYSGGFNADVYSAPPPTPIREDAPTRIFCFIEDLFFLAKIQEAARKLGVKVEFVKGDKETVARIIGTPEEERPALMVFDLNNPSVKSLTLIPKFKSKFKKTVSIIGFLNHLQGDLKLKAIEAGCDTVMPRSAFSQSLPMLLRRYGVEEEEEEYSQQPV